MPKKFRQFITNSSLILLITLAFSCANIVAPSGGPKDITPPKVVKTEPVNGSANFNSNKIRITFNEYVVLEDQANQLVISPPTKEEAEFNVVGKSIIIDLPKELNDSITYTIYFGQSIKDLNEGNSLNDFEYAFSKSSSLDSMMLQGNVYDALTLEPLGGILVMLYNNEEDSTPVKFKPVYITKTNTSGKFLLKNLINKKYKIIALKDMNSDMLFNQPNESIAFADSLLTPQFISTKTDTTLVKPDTSVNKLDSLGLQEVMRSTDLFMFVQPDTNQKLLKVRADKYGQFRLYFKYPVKDLKIIVQNKKLPENWRTDDYSHRRDTLTCWLTDPDLDTLKCIFIDNGKVIDSAEIALKQKPLSVKPSRQTQGKGFADEDISKLGITVNISPSVMLPYFLPVKINFSRPIATSDFTKISLSEQADSNFIEFKPQYFFNDTEVKRSLSLKHEWLPAKKYKLQILPGAFTDIYGLTNDSLSIIFSANSPENYGRLLFTVKNGEPGKSYILQLLKEDKTFIEQQPASPGMQVIFENLPPSNYHIRIVTDLNKNGKWDEGDYFLKRQPEPVKNFLQLINIRANWDTEYEFIM